MIADLFDSLLSMTMAGSLALIGVWIARLPVRRWFGAQIAYASWIVVPLVVIATLLPAPLASFKTVMTFARHTVTPSSAVIALQSSVDLRPALLLVWIAGVLAMLAWLIRQQRNYLRSLGPLHASKDASARIVQSGSLAGGPALVGALRPRIVLPADFASRYTPHERELILAHEHEHLARGDARINALVAAVRCLNWFNPLVHFASATFRFDQELACDAAVISRFPEARRPYADAMLKTQLIGQSRQELRLPVGCPWPSGHPLKERIAMLKYPLPTHTQRTVGALLVVLFGLGASYVAWASQTPQTAPTVGRADVTSDEPAKVLQLAENGRSPTKPAGYGRLKASKYPAAALASKATFVVYVTAQVDASGKVGATHAETEHTTVPLSADIKAAFIDTAVAGVKSWTFDPATNGGSAVASEVVVPIIFTMESAQPAPLQRSGTLDAIVISAADSSADGGTPAKASLLP